MLHMYIHIYLYNIHNIIQQNISLSNSLLFHISENDKLRFSIMILYLVTQQPGLKTAKSNTANTKNMLFLLFPTTD
jgi:hypothetical protein